MKTGAFTREAARCAACEFRDDCNNKMFEACAYILDQPVAARATTSATMPARADILVRHDYRDIKIADGTTVTIDLEEIKERLQQSFSAPYNYLDQALRGG